MIPKKPFTTYKWRWLCLTPTEGLLEPEVFLGVLRVLFKHEGQKASFSGVTTDLKKVKADTNTDINLARTGTRNLIRNSGQYWKGTGLLQPTHGLIQLTNLGKDVATGSITQSEFVAVMIDQTVLPNPWTYSSAEISKWNKAGLKIYPLKLIIQVMSELERTTKSKDDSYLTPNELIKVVIPLSGDKQSVKTISEYVIRYRVDPSIVKGWDDYALVSNDKRFAREFLLFLSNFGVCRKVDASPKENEKYYLDDPIETAVDGTGVDIFTGDKERSLVISAIRHSALPSIIDRKKVAASIYRRIGQDKFRRIILKAYGSTCLLTGERIPNILEAAHIIPVESKGSDDVNNGICLRVDVHRLFDLGNIRIRPSGDITLSTVVSSSKSYKVLPRKVVIPHFVSPANVIWRDSYL
jgi:HNH endonuclease